MIPAIGEALLHIRHLQRDLAHSLHLHHQRWEAPFLLSNNSRTELTWWLTYVTDKNSLPIQRIDNPTPAITIHLDASDIAWGVSSPEIETTGYWTDEEKTQSINVRESSAILFALQLHGGKYKNKTIKIYTDNITALKFVTKSGGTSSTTLQQLAVEIQDLCNYYNLKVEYQHIPGIENIQADKLSRTAIKSPLYEAQIPKKIFNMLNHQWGPLKIDAFASRTNHQLPRFWSLRPDPAAIALDAFSQPWEKTGMYLFPPWKLIPQVIQQIKRQKIQSAVLVTPLWTTQHWFPMVSRLKQLAKPITFKLQQWKMIAWKLSGRKARMMD
ncbi:hypothetical protein G6F43_012861 [Rhizopus delemar]|nr:hypothetical protein G6F43_012861 [Rhizopus delemar]